MELAEISTAQKKKKKSGINMKIYKRHKRRQTFSAHVLRTRVRVLQKETKKWQK